MFSFIQLHNSNVHIFCVYFHDCVLTCENCEDYVCPAKICIPVMCCSNNELP